MSERIVLVWRGVIEGSSFAGTCLFNSHSPKGLERPGGLGSAQLVNCEDFTLFFSDNNSGRKILKCREPLRILMNVISASL